MVPDFVLTRFHGMCITTTTEAVILTQIPSKSPSSSPLQKKTYCFRCAKFPRAQIPKPIGPAGAALVTQAGAQPPAGQHRRSTSPFPGFAPLPKK